MRGSALLFIGIGLAAAGQHGPLSPQRSRLDPALAPFYHGVASGDPLSDRVVIWTRVTTDSLSVDVQWRMALDTGMTQVVASGWAVAEAAHDHAVKVDVGGLAPYTFYYYEFEALGARSIRGRTRTLPEGQAPECLRLAVVSCSNYAAGWFNAYARITARNDVFGVVHLGDYIYEYGDGTFGSDRPLEPPAEILTLNDYRIRHSHYKLDPDLMRLHQQYPFFSVWDDHETANNSWQGGAENHQAGEGDWFARKSNGIRAYAEWMPLRLPDPGDTLRIYRRFDFADLLTLHMLDTRLIGRDEQTLITDNSPGRQLLGGQQYAWLSEGMQGSAARWQVLGQQVMVAPLVALGVPVNQDQWDGYPAERQRLYEAALHPSVRNLVVLTGDIHTSWANDLPLSGYNAQTGANSAGVEFVTTSVTSTSFDLPIPAALIQLLNPHIKYVDLTRKGYLLVDIREERVQGEWWYVSTVAEPSAQESLGAVRFTPDESRRLLSGSGASEACPSAIGVPAPLPPRADLPTRVRALARPVLIGAYPNPFLDRIALQLHSTGEGEFDISLHDARGALLLQERRPAGAAGIQHVALDAPGLEQGPCLLRIVHNGRTVSARLIKAE